ncbi:MAG: glucose-6-phosphate dehydrogenase, partial [Bacteroidales bacterium]
MQKPSDQIIVIFGASGDLTKRKLLPALYTLYKQHFLPDNFCILGVGRTELNDDLFRDKAKKDLPRYAEIDKEHPQYLNDFIERLHYISLDTGKVEQYIHLKEKLEAIAEEKSIPWNYIFYLATPPSLYTLVTEALAKHKLNRGGNGYRSSIIVEKPFGYDLKSAKELNTQLLKYFSEEQIYRIDHYLGKETVQNVMVTRFSNGIFEPLWNRNYIHHVEITSAESIGVENRGGYYESSGALRDMVQNHLLQVAALIAMEPPSVNNPTAIRNETLKVFQALKPLNETDIEKQVIRGQYTSSSFRGRKLKGYREEVGVDADSRTETFVALKMFIDNWRWGGVPFYIRTGKRLPTRVTEAVIHFNPTPHRLFCFDVNSLNRDNQLIIRIQPDEGILLKFGMKVPGAGYRVQEVNMDFHYSDLGDIQVPEAYQRLLLDCMNGDATLFTRGDAVEEAWRFIDPILEY